MTLWGIFIGAYLIGFSGALMPGPMLGVTIEGSLKKGWKTGPLIVLGHGILELILIIIMTFGLKDFFSNPTVAGFIGLFGGAFLAWMGYGMLKSGISNSVSLDNQKAGNPAGDISLNVPDKPGNGLRDTRANALGNAPVLNSLVLTGMLVSATNPYFIIWWASTGMESIRQAYTLGLIGVLFFYLGHILSDFTWYTAVSTALSRGRELISDRVYRWALISLGVFIIGFSIYFIGSGWKMLLRL